MQIIVSKQSSEAGFTMLEMLVVLSILALMAGAGLTLLRPPSGALQIKAAARQLCADLRLAHARALSSNQEIIVLIDVSRRQYVANAGPVAFPKNTEISVTYAATERGAREAGAFRFFPSGRSTGGDVHLMLDGTSTSVSVNWLTGEARCAN